MKAISLWQPWASLWLGPKIHETRPWATKFRGWLLVHAANQVVSQCGEALDELCIDEFGGHWRIDLPRGAIVGAVRIDHCQPIDAHLRDFIARESPANFTAGNWDVGRFAWRRDPVVKFARPVPFRGRQRFFEVPNELVADQLDVVAP